MNKFFLYFLELENINFGLNARKLVAKLEKALNRKCLDFLKKYSILYKLGRLDSLESLLDRGVSAKQLVDLIQRSDKNELGLYGSFPAVKEHIRGLRLVNEILNYISLLISELESKFDSKDSIDNVESLKNLIVTGQLNWPISDCYLIDRCRDRILKEGINKGTGRANDKKDFFCLVVLNPIKQVDNLIFVYNYIAYKKIFFRLFLVYDAFEEKHCVLWRKPGYIASDYLFTLDKRLRDKYPRVDRGEGDLKKGYSPCLFYALFLVQFYIHVSYFITLAKWWSRGRVKQINLEEPGDLELIKGLILKEYGNILHNIKEGIGVKYLIEFINALKHGYIHNSLSRFLFIVRDYMTNCIENTLKFIVKGQKHRGQCSYISHILFRIDKGFRESMFNHNRLYVNNLRSEKKDERDIPKSAFSFKNRHINLGNVRWYSTAYRSYSSLPPYPLSPLKRGLEGVRFAPCKGSRKLPLCFFTLRGKNTPSVLAPSLILGDLKKAGGSVRELGLIKKAFTKKVQNIAISPVSPLGNNNINSNRYDVFFNDCRFWLFSFCTKKIQGRDVFKFDNSFRLVYNNLLEIEINNKNKPIYPENQIAIETFQLNQNRNSKSILNKAIIQIADWEFKIFNKGLKVKEYCFNKIDEFCLDGVMKSCPCHYKKSIKDVYSLTKNNLILDYNINLELNTNTMDNNTNTNTNTIINYISLFYSVKIRGTFYNMVLLELNKDLITKISLTSISIGLSHISNKDQQDNYHIAKKLDPIYPNMTFSEYKEYFLPQYKNPTLRSQVFYIRLVRGYGLLTVNPSSYKAGYLDNKYMKRALIKPLLTRSFLENQAVAYLATTTSSFTRPSFRHLYKSFSTREKNNNNNTTTPTPTPWSASSAIRGSSPLDPLEVAGGRGIFSKKDIYNQRAFNIWIDLKLALGDYSYFRNSIIKHLAFRYNVQYSVITKIEKWEIYRTIIGSTPINCRDKNYTEDLENLYYLIQSIILEILSRYKNMTIGNPESLVLEFFSVCVETKYSLSKNTRELVNSKEYNMIVKELNFFGLPLKAIAIENFFSINENLESLKDIQHLKWDGESFDMEYPELSYFDTRYLKEAFKRSLIDYNLYLKRYNGKFFVIVNILLDDNLILRLVYNDKGFKCLEIRDTFDKKNKLIQRVRGNVIYAYDNTKLLYKQKNITFKPIKYRTSRKVHSTPNQTFATLDIETYKNKEGKGRAYNIGYYIHDPKELELFYIEKDLDSFKLIHRCFETLMRDKHHGRIIYVHNLGKFDSIFIIKALSHYNQYLDNPYSFDNICRDSDIIKLKIKRIINKKVRSVTLLDSWVMLPLSQRSLCKAYGLNHRDSKGYFPHSFVNEDTLWYEGHTPAKSYYSSEISNKEYKNLEKDDWHLIYESMKYLSLDLKSLHEIIRIVNRNLFFLFDIQITESITISSLALKILFTKFNNDKIQIPHIIDKDIYLLIKESYYGGRTEIFKPHGRNLYYYDVNSLYPFCAKKNLPGLNASYVEYYNYDMDINNLFGFFYCRVTSPNNPIHRYLGILPHRNSRGSLTFPIGTWHGCYFSEELKFAKEHGYNIQVLKGYKFNEIESTLKEYINKLAYIKANPENTAERVIAKLLMNSLVGRFGMNPVKTTSKLVNMDKHNLLLSTRNVVDSVRINHNLFLDSYYPSPDKEISTKFGLDYYKVMNNENHSEKRKQYNDFSSISTASAVLSYSRIYMAKAILYVLSKGGKVYYTDTDSLVIDIKLPEDWVSPNELGKFKLEHYVEEGYFLADKFYIMKTSKLDKKGNNVMVKATKGIPRNTVNWDIMKDLYNTSKPFNTTKLSSKKNILEGSVLLEESTIKLSLTYTKRKKVLNSKGMWIDTLPLYINEPENTSLEGHSLIIYNDFSKKLSLIVYVIYLHPLNLVLYKKKIIP